MMTIFQNLIAQAPDARRAAYLMGAAAVVLGSIAFTGNVQARDNVQFSVQIGSPGYSPNYAYPVYSPPPVVYAQPRPVYVQPRPVYVQPAPIYYQVPPVYYRPAPVTYGYPSGPPQRYHNGHGRGHGNHGWNQNRGGYYVQPQQSYGQVYYQR